MSKFLIFIVAIIVIGIIRGIIEAIRDPHGTGRAPAGDVPPGATVLNPLEHGFRGRVRVDQERMDDGTPLEVFDFQIKGVIVGPSDMWSGVVRVGAIDITESKDDGYPVLCAIDALQQPDTCIFGYTSPVQPFNELSFIENWVTLFKVPIEALQFAKRGRRRLCFGFGVCGAYDDEQVHVYDEVEIEFDVREPGYVDLDNMQREIDRLTVKLALIVSAADGVLDRSEGAVVQTWIRKRLSVETDHQRAMQLKDELNRSVREAGSLTDNPSRHVATICEQIVKKGAHAHRYDALELCLEVAGADGTAEQEELAIIEEIARNLEIDAHRFKEMVQKALPVAMFADKDPDSVLGITENMPKEEIRRLLSEEYRKWNSRASHSDKKVREQATEMLTLIASARKRHIG